MKKKINPRLLAVTAMLAAVSAVLMFFEFQLPIFPSFIKMDFSDIPALVGAFAIGPAAGVLIELVKNLIHVTMTQTGGVGELANFIVGGTFVLTAGLVYRFRKTRGGALLAMSAGTVAMALAAAFANYTILIPFFTAFMPLDTIISICAAIIPAVDSLEKVILLSIVPFNIFKGVIISLVTFFLYKTLSSFIHSISGTAKKA